MADKLTTSSKAGKPAKGEDDPAGVAQQTEPEGVTSGVSAAEAATNRLPDGTHQHDRISAAAKTNRGK